MLIPEDSRNYYTKKNIAQREANWIQKVASHIAWTNSDGAQEIPSRDNYETAQSNLAVQVWSDYVIRYKIRSGTPEQELLLEDMRTGTRWDIRIDTSKLETLPDQYLLLDAISVYHQLSRWPWG